MKTLRWLIAGIVATVPSLSMMRSAAAACADWRPRVEVLLEDADTVKVDSLGVPWGLRVRYMLTIPFRKSLLLKLAKDDLAAMTEVTTLAGERVVPLPTRHLVAGSGSGKPYDFSVDDTGKPSAITLPPDWLALRAAGRYRVRFGFKYWDLPPHAPPGVKLTTPMCEAWSEWAEVEFHPVMAVPDRGASTTDRTFPLLDTGLLAATGLTETYWVYRDEPGGPARKVPLGRTAEYLRAPGVPSRSSFEDLDARVDASGVVHIVVAVAGGKTAYVKMGPKGKVLERRELPGRKKLAGPMEKIILVDKARAPIPGR